MRIARIAWHLRPIQLRRCRWCRRRGQVYLARSFYGPERRVPACAECYHASLVVRRALNYR